MKPCGVILTYMDLRKVKKWWFNLPLLIGQLMFIVAGTAYGKIKWPKPLPIIRLLCILAIVVAIAGIIVSTIEGNWYSFAYFAIVFIYFLLEYRNIPWRRVWRAAQVSHVRLCLKELPYSFPSYREGLSRWQYINFGYPEAELQYWRMDECDGRRFEYRPPTFDPSSKFIKAMQQYAYDQVDKGYDDLQLISSGLHLIAWIVWPWSWGKELKVIKAFNRPGGREHCISGLTACLRWGEPKVNRGAPTKHEDKEVNKFLKMLARMATRFFKGYDTAVIPPCLVEIDRNWREG